MALITLERAAKVYGTHPVFEDVNLSVNEGERIGLVGVNGGGKSTLLNVLVGELGLDRGERRLRRGLRIGYLEQMARLESGRTAYEEALAGAQAARDLQSQLRVIETEMARGGDGSTLAALADRHAELSERFARVGGEGFERFVEASLTGLGLPRTHWSRPLRQLSSGQRVRVQLARLLQGDFEVLLLDEPTNHLDVDGIAWLASHLVQRPEGLIVVSHDRWFLDRVVTRVVEIDRGRLQSQPGTLSDYLQARALRLKTALRAYEKREEMIRKNEEFVRRAAHGNKPGVAQSRKKMLEKIERLEKPPEDPVIHIRLGGTESDLRELLAARDVGFAHAGHTPLFHGMNLHVTRGDRIGVVGPNGSGKTTFLKVLAGTLTPDHGEVWHSSKLKLAVYEQELAGLRPEATLLEQVMSTDPELTEGQARGRLGAFGFSGDTVFRTASSLSGGEQGRLSLLKTILEGGHLLLLDEPTNHLDVFTRQAFLRALETFPGAVILVTHDRYLLDAWAHRIVLVDGPDSVVREGNYSAFRAWREEQQRLAATPGDSAATTKTARRKALRAQREERAASRKKRRFWKLKDLEAAIIQKEAELEEVEAQFADPDVARDGARIKELVARSETLKIELAELNQEWEEWG